MSDSAEVWVVLLLEDEALIAIALQDELEDAGYSVAGPFTSCASALEWLTANKPHVAVLDTVLKDGPCSEVATTLAGLSVPFVVYSGHDRDLNAVEALDGARWLEKPAEPAVLLEALRELRTPLPARI